MAVGHPLKTKEMGKVKVIISWTDNYGAYCDLVPGCVATHRTLEGVEQAFAEALQAHIEGMIEDGDPVPAELRGKYELEFHLNIRALLHYTEGIVPRTALARVSGINEKQLGHYATGWRNPRPDMQRKIVDGIHTLGKRLIALSL